MKIRITVKPSIITEATKEAMDAYNNTKQDNELDNDFSLPAITKPKTLTLRQKERIAISYFNMLEASFGESDDGRDEEFMAHVNRVCKILGWKKPYPSL